MGTNQTTSQNKATWVYRVGKGWEVSKRPLHRIGNDWWVEMSRSRTRLVLKKAHNEIHGIRLGLGKTQVQMGKTLNIGQSYYSKLESEVLPCPAAIFARMKYFDGK